MSAGGGRMQKTHTPLFFESPLLSEQGGVGEQGSGCGGGGGYCYCGNKQAESSVPVGRVFPGAEWPKNGPSLSIRT